MQKLSLALILCCAQFSHACETPLTFQVGPFFSTTFIVKYWREFASEVAIQSDCKVVIASSSSYEQYLDTLVARDGDMFIVPNHYVKALTKRGLTPTLISSKNAQAYILSRRNIKTLGSSALTGDTILVPSRYTRVYLEFEKWLAQEVLQGKVNFDFNHTHDSATMLMIQGKRSSAVVMGSVYRALPPFIQQKYQVTLLGTKSGATILTKPNTPQNIIEAMIRSKDKLNFLTWNPVTLPYQSDPFSDTFAAQLKTYLENLD